MIKTDDQIYIEGIVNSCTRHLQTELTTLKKEVEILKQEQKLPVDFVSGTVWVVEDRNTGVIAGMFDSQEKARNYTRHSMGMAITNMEVV